MDRHLLSFDDDPRLLAFMQLLTSERAVVFAKLHALHKKHPSKKQEIPAPIQRAIRFLQREASLTTENLFAFQYVEHSRSLNKCRKDIEDQEDFATKGVADPHLVAEILKRYLRDFSGGVVHWEVFDPSVSFGHLPDKAARVKYITECIESLPTLNCAVAEAVTSLIDQTAASSATNGMDTVALCGIFGPLLLHDAVQFLEYQQPRSVKLKKGIVL